LAVLHRCLKVKMEVSEAVVELLKVAVAARNDTGSHRLSKFRVKATQECWNKYNEARKLYN